MRVLLSIKPEYAFKIFDGTKKFEFRKVIFKNSNIKKVVVYASSPVQQVIGEFEIDNIVSLSPENIWRMTSKHSGISKVAFFEYFAEREIAHAIKIKKVKRYKQPLNLYEDFKVVPPPILCLHLVMYCFKCRTGEFSYIMKCQITDMLIYGMSGGNADIETGAT